MSGIFDALRTALKRPENDKVDQEERDVHSDGEVNQVSELSFTLPWNLLTYRPTLGMSLIIVKPVPLLQPQLKLVR